ncbi:MAG: DUF4091 domain-containing protein [Clostridia bacterium]|nr:DUF4091 domain-containing protein [Clostridia bacterium]
MTVEPATAEPATGEPATNVPATQVPATNVPTPTKVPATATPKPTTAAPTPTAEPGPDSNIRVTFKSSKAATYFTGGNAVKAESVTDADYGRVIKLSTTSATNDPFISFNYKKYMTDYGLTQASASTYKVVVMKIKQEKCSSTQSEIFYMAGNMVGATPGYSKTSVFDNSDPDWQYVIYDLTNSTGWSGNINGFRFDYMYTAQAAGESIYIGELIFAKNLDEVVELLGGGGADAHALSAADQQRAEQLINSASDPAPSVSNKKLNAAHEDSDISLWFNHPYVKTPEASTKSTGLNTYQIRMAKNEIEGVQFLLASTKAKTGLTAELTPFTDASGNTLRHVICYGYYFDDVEGQSIVDPIPELEGSFDLKANKSKTFLIKVYTEKTTKAGQYSATLTIKDSAGREIKKAKVYVYVWNFALPDACSCKIQADLSWWNIYSANPPWTYYGDDGVAYERYYEYLLENKVNAYNLPYMDSSADNANPFPDPRVNKYLNDPRVQCFNPVGFGTDRVTQARVQNAYNYLKQNPEWLAKAYFYPVDEPIVVKHNSQIHNLEDLVNLGNMIKSIWGNNYKLIAPMHINQALNSSSTEDFFSYVAGVVNVWCPKTYFFNTMADYKNNPKLMFQYYTAMLEKNLGTFVDRMAAEQAGGDEVWWYVTRFPHHPEITLSISDPEVEHRILFWQQKLYNVDGFLYYLVNDWWLDYIWTSKHETDNSYPYNVYGNGVLVYNGFKDANGDFYISREHFDEMDDHSFTAYPVGCLRLESVRDGAEDYDYFTILDQLYGEGTSDLIIKQITTSLGNYSDDDELFNSLRIAVGNLIAARS